MSWRSSEICKVYFVWLWGQAGVWGAFNPFLPHHNMSNSRQSTPWAQLWFHKWGEDFPPTVPSESCAPAQHYVQPSRGLSPVDALKRFEHTCFLMCLPLLLYHKGWWILPEHLLIRKEPLNADRSGIHSICFVAERRCPLLWLVQLESTSVYSIMERHPQKKIPQTCFLFCCAVVTFVLVFRFMSDELSVLLHVICGVHHEQSH